MLNQKKGLTIAAMVFAVAVIATTAALALGAFDGRDADCGSHAVSEVRAQNGSDRFTVRGAPPGSVAAGGGQRIEVNGHRVHLGGPGHLTYVRCGQ